MKVINHWWTTRPKRKLITAVDALRVFMAVAEGKEWRGNRDSHLAFETALEQAKIKGVGERRDQQGGGGRTYAAWLYSFGLWFEDQSNLVRLTFAGEDLVKYKPPVPIFTKQLLDFQYPSPYSIITKVNPRFKIFPFRFLLKLLLSSKLEGRLTKAEIARFVITKAETDSDFDEVVSSIVAYRNTGSDDSIIDNTFEQTFGSISKLEDVANTFINQLEYTQLILRDDAESYIFIPDSCRRTVERLVAAQPPLINREEEYSFFQRKYGLGPHHQRDNRTFGQEPMISARDAERSSVLLALSDILVYRPVDSIDDKLIKEISQRTGVVEREVDRIITALGIQPSFDIFEEKFLQLSVGGTATASEFEQATEGVFGEQGLGYYTEWIGRHPNNPDVLALSLNEGEKYVGIIDAKAYKEYTLDGDQRRRMTHVYIPKFRQYKQGDDNLDLAFFSYVAGGFGSTIDKGIKQIASDTQVSGFGITARELIKMLREHKSRPYSKTELKSLFTSNRQLLSADLARTNA
jgi:hypothetical protein